MDQKNSYELIWYDTETTGLNVCKDKITEIAAISESDKIFNKLFKIGEQLSQFIINLTGITDIMLEKEGVEPRQGLEEFYKYIQSFNLPVVLIAHNGDNYDKLIIDSTFRRVIGDNAPYLSCYYIHHFDTKVMAKFLYPNLKSYSLKNLCKEFKIENSNHHRALNDALVCQRLFEHMLNESKYMDFRDLYLDIYGSCLF